MEILANQNQTKKDSAKIYNLVYQRNVRMLWHFGLFDVQWCLTVSDCIVLKIYDSARHLSAVEQLWTIMVNSKSQRRVHASGGWSRFVMFFSKV